MQDSLGRARQATRREMEAFLAEAEREMQELEGRHSELLKAVAAARTWLGVGGGREEGPMALHDAMALVLRDHGNEGMRAPELADEINRRGLYRMRDGRPADAHQVHARVHNYPDRFAREDGRIRLSQDARS